MATKTVLTRWRINTPGPSLTRVGTEEQVKAYVEGMCPLKRGWTGEWVTYPEAPGNRYYVRRNSKGKKMRGYGVVIYPTGPAADPC